MTGCDLNSFQEDGIIIDQLCKVEFIGVAVYTVPDKLLVKANQKYLDTLETQNELVQRCWDKAVISKTVISITEYEYKSGNGDVTYWDSALNPIIEAGQI
jgi:hypothetical protein